MAKVIPFRSLERQGPAVPVGLPAAPATRPPIFRWLGLSLLWTFRSLFRCCRIAVVTVLVALRPLVFAVLRPLSGFLLIAFIVALIARPANIHIPVGFGVLTFCAFLVMHLYDSLLVALTGYQVVRVLD